MKRRKRKIKIHYGNLFLFLIVLGLLTYGIYYLYDHFKEEPVDNNKINTNHTEKSKSYKHLDKLGYSEKDINIIISNMNEEDILNINTKDEDLTLFVSDKYFHLENLERYKNYKNSSDEKVDEIIMKVNIGIDEDFYSNIRSSIDPDGLFVLVNKYYKLDDEYEPKNLINVGNGEKMQKEAGEALISMLGKMKDDGLSIMIVSGYRSISTQRAIYNRQVTNKGQVKADLVSARPGHSEHHTGLAIDIDCDGKLEEYFENTEQFEWLSKNAYKYGFILRYPKGKTYITGYSYEPWHYRYVGVEAATIIHNEDITFEEYYVKYKGLY